MERNTANIETVALMIVLQINMLLNIFWKARWTEQINTVKKFFVKLGFKMISIQ
jgi:hypothetical protein